MDKRNMLNEGEMGSGDSDDEFFNVKLPCTPSDIISKSAKKVEIKKVYSPPRNKIQYDYKFDSSSDDDFENLDSKSSKLASKEPLEKSNSSETTEKEKETVQENTIHSQNTFKVVENINEELKNMKNTGGKEKMESENSNAGQSHINTSIASGVKVSQPQLGVVSPVVVVPPQIVVPQAPVMNISPMIVPSPLGMASQNIMAMMPSQNIMGVGGNMLRGPNSMGGLIATPNAAISNTMMGMNAVPGMMGNVMGLQGGIINPAAVGSINMAVQGNMMRMADASNSMLRMQTPGNNLMGVQGTSNMLGISTPNGNVIGVPRAMNVSPSGNLMGNPGGIMVGPGGVINNSMMSNPGNLMVMSNMVANPNIISPNQANAGTNTVRMVNNVSANSPVRPLPPPFARVKPPPPPPPPPPPNTNFQWQSSKIQTCSPKIGPTTSRFSPSMSPPASSPIDKDSNDHDVEEFSKEGTDNLSERSPTVVETDESQSPPRELSNTFKNDGSFMELFKKMKEESNKEEKSSSEKSRENVEAKDSSSANKKLPVMLSGIVGKRRGGRVLKTGLVKKVKKESDQDEEKHPKDAWSIYMAEVKKYREASCEEEGKTRPLVK